MALVTKIIAEVNLTGLVQVFVKYDDVTLDIAGLVIRNAGSLPAHIIVTRPNNQKAIASYNQDTDEDYSAFRMKMQEIDNGDGTTTIDLPAKLTFEMEISHKRPGV